MLLAMVATTGKFNILCLQGMMANRYMNTFRDEILGWNKKLMNVADVNQIITEIQRTWAYLESLFIHSEEVKKELPEAAVRFANIDKEVKIILKVGLNCSQTVLSWPVLALLCLTKDAHTTVLCRACFAMLAKAFWKLFMCCKI